MRYVALLRGINVGGKSTVSMSLLKTCLEDLGYAEVRTYINSGNVIFETVKSSPRKLESRIEKALAKRFGFPIRVFVRDARQMALLAGRIPKKWRASKTHRVYVVFLSAAVDKPSILKTVPARDGIDQAFYVNGAVVWATPFKALTRSGLQRVAGDPIYKEITMRNVTTALKIHELMTS